MAKDHGLGNSPKNLPLSNLLLEQLPGAPASLFRARNQQLYYWSMRKTCFHLTWVHFPLKNIPLLWSDNFSLVGRWGRTNMTNGESSCLETRKAAMERNFCQQTPDMGDLPTCCLHKSTCKHCTLGLPRDSLKTKPIKTCKVHGMQKAVHNLMRIGRHWTAEKIGSIPLGKGIDKNRKSCRVLEIIPLNTNADKRLLSVLLLRLLI